MQEALQVFQQADGKGLNPLYYGGGTEIISMARVNSVRTGAVIDIKAIPQCRECTANPMLVTLGAGVTLSQICEANTFPLLSKAAGRIADHTIQCKLTLGGNLAGTIIYREAVLPLLLTDCTVEIFGPEGLRQVPISTVFDRSLRLSRGELLIRILIGREYAGLPYVHAKKTPIEKIGYPVVTVCALKKDGRIRLALSGVCEYPFRSAAMEDALNAPSLPAEQRARNAIHCIPSPALSDEGAGAEYRKFVLYHSLLETLERL